MWALVKLIKNVQSSNQKNNLRNACFLKTTDVNYRSFNDDYEKVSSRKMIINYFPLCKPKRFFSEL